ncbi:uroporphyrinogen-III C-methyltransferase [Candidatus Glomeribacter gigasporarum]|nr:uroporphyrinogen-III C-methyltransferase [Candidatus Glomeribacter gigasporarum]
MHGYDNEMIHLPVGQLSSVLCHAKRGSPKIVMKCGKVYLIGAGPGDADLLTVKAARLIGQVDTILVDDLVNRDVLRYARTDAEIIHVGKRGGRMSTPQEYINQLCLEHVEAGKDVARLKGGDPFIFGRGGEELFTLRRAGVVVEVISGLTSGIAVPAAFDIPLTYRHIAQTATFVTGTTSGNDEVCWRSMVELSGTLVIYMGISRLEHITQRLLASGLDPDMPAAAIQNGTLAEQRFLLSRVCTLAADIRAAKLQSPAIIIIGSVVSLAHS